MQAEEIRTAASTAEATRAPVSPVLPIEGERELLEAARAGPYDSWEHFRCRLLAATAIQTPSFDRLLAAEVARGIVPLEYQTHAVRQILSRMRGRGMLCDEVGMGKTIEAGLATLELVLRGLARRVLILTPPSLLGQWKEEMAGKFQLNFVTSEEPGFQGWDQHERIIASIHTAKREPHASQIEACRFDLLIADEAHHLRHARTQSFHFVSRLQPRYLFLLTATPVQNSLEDLFQLVSLVRPGLLSTLREFRRQFLQQEEPLLAVRPEELRKLLREVMIRNRRATSGVRFTRRYATTIRIEMSDAEKKLYQEASRLVRRFYATEQRPKERGVGKQRLNGRGPSERGLSRMLLRILQAELGSSPAAAWSSPHP